MFNFGKNKSQPADTNRVAINTELEAIKDICYRAARGDFEARITNIPENSQYKAVALAINRLLDISDAFVREAGAAMENCSQERFHRPILLRGMHGTYKKNSQVINAAGRKMKASSQQMDKVSNLATETAESVTSVAAACEELSATTGEISKQTKETSTIGHEVWDIAKRAQGTVSELENAAGSIIGVVELISKITRQTNLLALNATIEAARAGEAGVSFGVVASEVKKLSNNIAEATKKINGEVEAMQNTMKGVVDSIGSINGVMDRFSNSSEEVNLAVNEQVKATADIANSLSKISANSNMVSESIKTVKAMK